MNDRREDVRCEAFARVAWALGKRPTESLDDAAARVARDGMVTPAQMEIALVVLGPGEPWSRIFKAATLSRPRLVK